MVDYALIQARVDYGYAKAASALGAPYQQYRASEPDNPTSTPLGSLNVWATTDAALKGTTPPQFGKPQWYAAVDRNGLAVGDYLVGQQGTFFVSTLDYPSPVGLVFCNRIVSIARALDSLQLGANTQRFGTSIQTAEPFMTCWPASLLQLGSGSKMVSTGMNLPSDSKVPGISVLLPVTAPQIRFNDLVTDDLGQRYLVSSVELSALGWRVTGEMQPPG